MTYGVGSENGKMPRSLEESHLIAQSESYEKGILEGTLQPYFTFRFEIDEVSTYGWK